MEEMGLIGCEVQNTYCTMRGDDLSDDPLLWEATTKVKKMGTKTLHRLINQVFKLTAESFGMGRFQSWDGGPWDKLIWVQELCYPAEIRCGQGLD